MFSIDAFFTKWIRSGEMAMCGSKSAHNFRKSLTNFMDGKAILIRLRL